MIPIKHKLIFICTPWKWPEYILWRIFKPVPWGLALVNLICQRLLRINSAYKFPIHFTSRVVGDVKIGKDVWVSFATSGGCYVQGHNGVIIGDGTIIAAGVKIISANHAPQEINKWLPAPPIVIGQNVWVGANAVILPGVQVGEKAVIGAAAVVTKSIPDRAIAVGNPARIIKYN